LKIYWLEQAVTDLEEAYEFILFDNPSAAEHEVNKVLEAVELLSDNPAMGKAGRVAKTRELVVAGTPYIVIYRVKGNRLEILRIFHGARQWPDKNMK
jgi:addiction module RelE/StbE family toxin